MIPLLFKAIKPGAPVKTPEPDDQEEGAAGSIPDENQGPPQPVELPAGADGEDGVDENPDSVDETPPAVDEKPAADAPPEATDPDDADGDAAADADGDEPPADAPMSNFTELLALVAERMSPEGAFGPDVVKPGHHVAFAAGDFAGSGKVAATGRDGVKVHDSSGREHSVHWREVTGHFAGDDEEGAADAAAPAAEAVKPAKPKAKPKAGKK